MAERGDVFSYLYPFASLYYRKFGYETGMRLLSIKAPLEPCRALRQRGRAERFIPGEGGSDPAPIIEIYNDFASQYNLCVDREGWRWHDLLEHDPVMSRRQAYIWNGEDGRPGAYVLFKSHPDRDPDEMHVLEAAWRSREALLGLLGFMAGFCSNLKTVVWDLPPSLSPELIWPEDKDISVKIVYPGMNRVVNAQKAFRLMRKPQGQGSVRVSVKDDFLQKNTGVYKIDWENGEGSVRKVKSSTTDMECSIHALAQLVTGYLPFDQLRLRQDIAVNTKADELERLFIKKDIYLADHF
jgi:predicted acetyltransferase